MKKAPEIVLSDEEYQTLTSWIKSHKIEKRLSNRAQIILLAFEGKNNKEIAEIFNTREARISKWRSRFYKQRIKGLYDAERTGKPRTYDENTEKRILDALNYDPPKGYSTWTGSLLAVHLSNVSDDQVWRVLKKHGIHLQRRHSWCISTDPEFSAKAADIIGLYLDPPQNAIVISVDEKPAIQALERAQGWLKLPNGKAITGYNHEYKRHGTVTLFAALEITTGLVKTKQFKRRRRKEFLDFMNEIIKDYGDKEIHVILDNLKTHKPKHDKWLARHKNVHLHYTPTHASWLNQIEIWFSIFSRQALRSASFTSVLQLKKAINDYCKAYNKEAAPFEWKKSKVYQKSLKLKYAN